MSDDTRWLADPQRETKTITRVDAESGGWAITQGDGWTFYVPKSAGIEPRVGDTAIFFGEGIGRPVRGLVINDRVVYYRSAEEETVHQADERRRREQAQRDDFDRERADFDRQYAALPPVFRRRLERFRRNNADFRWRYEGYELSCCVDAVKIAAACATPDGVIAFRDMPWDAQTAQVPDLFRGHSGNSFGMACRLAWLYLSTPGIVEWEHGAMCALAGCDEYGCTPTATPEQIAAAEERGDAD